MLNERMLQDGYAVLFTIQPNSKYSERFRKAQRIAWENRRGIWGKDGLREKPLDYKRAHPRMSNVMIREELHSPYLLSSRRPDRSGPAQAALLL
jgi:hypothetical protein